MLFYLWNCELDYSITNDQQANKIMQIQKKPCDMPMPVSPMILWICEKNDSTKAWGQIALNLGVLHDFLEFILLFIKGLHGYFYNTKINQSNHESFLLYCDCVKFESIFLVRQDQINLIFLHQTQSSIITTISMHFEQRLVVSFVIFFSICKSSHSNSFGH